MILRKLDIHVQKNELRSLSHIEHKNKHKIDCSPKTKILWEENRSESLWPWVRQWLVRYNIKSTKDKRKNR